MSMQNAKSERLSVMTPSLVQSTVGAALLSSLLSSSTITNASDFSSKILEARGRTWTPSSLWRGGLSDPPLSTSSGRRRRRGGKAEIVDSSAAFGSDRDGSGIFVAETFRDDGVSLRADSFDGGADDEEELQLALRFPNDDGGGGGAASPSGRSAHRHRFDLASLLRSDRSLSLLSRTDDRLEGIVPVPPSSYRRTGTTIAGVVCDSGRTVVVGADTRATDGTVVADKRCSKIHELASNVWACGAGTSGDIDALVRRARFVFLLRGTIESTIGNDVGGGGEGGGRGRWRPPPARVAAVCTYLRDALYKGNGSIGANLVLGGYDHASSRAMLAAIHPHGSMDCVPFTALGSGGLAATAVLENGYGGIDMSVEDAKDLVVKAIRAGITNDLGSGSQVDLCVIGSDGAIHRRAAVEEEGLPPVPSEGEDDDEVEADSRAVVIMRSGVNGFGSLPYAVKSKRIVVEPEGFISQRKDDWLDKVLNLDAR